MARPDDLLRTAWFAAGDPAPAAELFALHRADREADESTVFVVVTHAPDTPVTLSPRTNQPRNLPGSAATMTFLPPEPVAEIGAPSPDPDADEAGDPSEPPPWRVTVEVDGPNGSSFADEVEAPEWVSAAHLHIPLFARAFLDATAVEPPVEELLAWVVALLDAAWEPPPDGRYLAVRHYVRP